MPRRRFYTGNDNSEFETGEASEALMCCFISAKTLLQLQEEAVLTGNLPAIKGKATLLLFT